MLNNVVVVKRDGRKIEFDSIRIKNAISKAMHETRDDIYEQTIINYTNEVINKIQELNINEISVEQIQDLVQKVLIENNEFDIVERYIIYRSERTEFREANSELMKEYKDLTFKDSRDNNKKRENANIDGNTSMGTMLQFGTSGSKKFVKHILKKEHIDSHNDGIIHIHDLDFEALGTLTCAQIDIINLFKSGFSTGHGHLREPQCITSYSALAAIAIQSNQNDQHGGQSIPNFDYGLAIGVKKTFKREFIDVIKMQNRLNDSNIVSDLSILEQQFGTIEISNINIKQEFPKIYELALEKTERKTYQAMEAFIHNLNTMHSRAGAQVPFSSINFGTDTSPEGRMVIKQFLLATEAGLGNKETAIFPISVFKVKEGINYNTEDPNYDLFKLSCRVSAKRLFPNYVFLDAPHNIQYYKPGRPETEAVAMGCRTRVISSVFPESDGIVYGRGNNSFTSINLPRLGIKHGIALNERVEADLKSFYKDLDKSIDIVISQLLERYNIQKNKKVKNFPFLMGQGVWFGSDKLGWEDTLEEVIKHGTLTCGFIGLAETLVALTGKHHGECGESQKLGLEIIGYMRKRMDEASKQYTLNFSLIATPAEGLSGRFIKMDRKLFGKIKGITDKKYYTNGFHIPVYFNIQAFDKIKIEAPYHSLTNAGHITYIELDGDASKNIDAFEMIIRTMKEAGIGYGSINHPVDRDSVCGFSGVIGDRCPKCGRLDGENGPKFERIRRITGYLVGGLDRWNDAKKAEEADRVKHK